MKSTYTESQENYIETIYILSQKKPVVRSVDIANELDYKKSSISIAMKALREEGLITVSSEGYINLTDAGMKIATDIYDRHQVLTAALTNLGIPADIAEEDACRIEHIISQTTFDAIKAHWKKSL